MKLSSMTLSTLPLNFMITSCKGCIALVPITVDMDIGRIAADDHVEMTELVCLHILFTDMYWYQY